MELLGNGKVLNRGNWEW